MAGARKLVIGASGFLGRAVDARAWLRDPAPLFRTNVGGRTIRIPAEDRPASEDDSFNWAHESGGHNQSRVAAENLVLRYARARGLPAVALSISNTYGPGDFAPTPARQADLRGSNLSSCSMVRRYLGHEPRLAMPYRKTSDRRPSVGRVVAGR